MKVIDVNSPTFLSEQRFLSKKSFANMQKLLVKMNEQTVYTELSPNQYVSEVLDRIYVGKKGYFMDGRWLPKKNYLPTELIKGSSYVAMHKTQIRIHNLDGKAEIIQKPWYRTPKGIIKKVEEFIKTGVSEFNNTNVVEKQFHRIQGYTNRYKKYS